MKARRQSFRPAEHSDLVARLERLKIECLYKGLSVPAAFIDACIQELGNGKSPDDGKSNLRRKEEGIPLNVD
jgi:hypothetical protein